jgi:Fe-S cluster assembly protein SufD
VRVCLEGEGADVSLDGLYMPRGDQHHDNPVLVVHAAPRGTSRQLYKGVVDEHGHGVFNGHVVVRPDAFGTDARQTNKNLLLSDDAEIDTRPRLEILTDDVKCAHGAAVGRLDEDALFYLRSRGVPAQMARGILTYAFAREMVDLIPLEPLRARVEELVADRLGTSRNERATWPPNR